MNWKKKSDLVPTTIEELREILLKNRGITKQNLDDFFNSQSPIDLTLKDLEISKNQLDGALKLIKKTINNDKKIVIFGDYDVDGICASAILWQALFKLYRAKHPNGTNHPVPFIPHREKNGYGITTSAVDELIQTFAPQLIITVDNGIVAHDPIAYAREKNIDVILTDHHQPELKEDKPHFPDANFVVFTTKLCGASVAWILARALDKDTAKKTIELAGVATISDQVPLLNANRSFAKAGLDAIKVSKNLGIIELCKAAKLVQAEINEGTVGFVLAPRINAIGRLGHGLEALRLLCTQNQKQAKGLAKILNDTNILRQDMTKLMLEDAVAKVANSSKENILIVNSQKYHEGLIGLIASGLTEKYHKPAIAISIRGELAKASARSVKGINIVEILREIKKDLISVGGHPMAAGFSFLSKNLDNVSDKLLRIARSKISKDKLEKALNIDCELPASMVTVPVSRSVSNFAPFGVKNPRPIFKIKNLKVVSTKILGKENEHFKLKVVDSINDSSETFDCLGWGIADKIENVAVGREIEVAGYLEVNQWKQNKFAQVIIKDLRLI